jgi:hypothetical protein
MLALGRQRLALDEKEWGLVMSLSILTQGDHDTATELLAGQVCSTAHLLVVILILDEVHNRCIYPHAP